MFVKSLKIDAFGDILDREFTFTEGVNILRCKNRIEAETVRDFIVAMLYGSGNRSDGGFRKKYFPGSMFKFGGRITVEMSGREYEITQHFGKIRTLDESSVFDITQNVHVNIFENRPIGEQIFNISEDAFKTAFIHDFYVNGNELGYVTPELSLSDNENDSFYSVKTKICDRLDGIKNTKTKKGELDRLIINKMEMNNRLTRMNEAEQKIHAKRIELESLKAERDTLKSSAKVQFRKIEIAKSCERLLVKDKVQTITSVLKTDCDALSELETRKAYLGREKVTKKLVFPVIFSVIGLLAAVFGALFSYIVFAAGLLALATGLVLLFVTLSNFKKRFLIIDKGIKVDISERINELRKKCDVETENLTYALGGKTLDEQLKLWHEAEENLRDATEDERRNAIMKKNDEDEILYNELIQKIKPIEAKIEVLLEEIDKLSSNLASSYTEAQTVLLGIEDKIKALGNEYKIMSFELENYEKSDEIIKQTLIPNLFGDANKLLADYYNVTDAGFAVSEDYKVSFNGNENDAIKAKISLASAISKNLLLQEAQLSIFTFNAEAVTGTKLPPCIRQVITFAN